MHPSSLLIVRNSNVSWMPPTAAAAFYTTGQVLLTYLPFWRRLVNIVATGCHFCQNSTANSISLSSVGLLQSDSTSNTPPHLRKLILNAMLSLHWISCLLQPCTGLCQLSIFILHTSDIGSVQVCNSILAIYRCILQRSSR